MNQIPPALDYLGNLSLSSNHHQPPPLWSSLSHNNLSEGRACSAVGKIREMAPRELFIYLFVCLFICLFIYSISSENYRK